MTKSEYELELVYLKSKRREITEKIESIKVQYIESNKTFELGDRLKTRWGDFGIVTGFDLDWDGNVKPLMKKEKKDGKQSKFNLTVFKVSDVSLADNF